mmetsp:Transcript_15920/g.22681  ORF Transcript_15920/g.22681 Transcript_15920/m.22681 type:complete len:407 (-) Transcript_15920:52-1272(-)
MSEIAIYEYINIDRCTFQHCPFVAANDGCLYAIPHESDRKIIKFNPINHEIEEIRQQNHTSFPAQSQNWSKSVLAENGCIYSIPYNANQFIKFDPVEEKSSLVGQKLEGQWDSGILARNGCIYCLPEEDGCILKLDTWTDRSALLNFCITIFVPYSDLILAGDGCIYCIPFNAQKVMKIDPTDESFSFIGDTFPEKSKWSGGVLASDGCIYCIPYNSTQFLKINIYTHMTSLIGPIILGDLKFRTGTLGRDGCIYATPKHYSHLIKLDPKTDTIHCIGDSLNAEWIGATVAQNEHIYCIPARTDTQHLLCIKSPQPSHTLFTPFFRKFLFNHQHVNCLQYPQIYEYFNRLENKANKQTEFDMNAQRLYPHLLDYSHTLSSPEQKLNIIYNLIRNFPTCVISNLHLR